MDYTFMTVEELANALEERVGSAIGFTFDTPEDLTDGREPSGWYGASIVENFGGESVIFGDYGVGILNGCYLSDTDSYHDETLVEILIRFFTEENGWEFTKDSYVCVDKADLQ